MKKLFIIGNGFDLSHKIHSSYEHFHQFLEKNYTDEDNDSLIIPESFMLPDGEIAFDDTQVIIFLRRIISEAEQNSKQWSDIETSLGKLDFTEFLDDWFESDEDDNEWHRVYRNEYNSADIAGATIKIQDYFREWIDSIDLSDLNQKEDFQKLMDKDNDLFLSFNYTLTLEKLYSAKNVCHIHGKQGEYLLFGHGDDTDNTDYYMRNYIGSKNVLQELHKSLRKDTRKALINNSKFFDLIQEGIDQIFSYGFSFSCVDLIYIKELCSRVDTTNLTWFLNDYDDENKRNIFIKRIRACGFRGEFKTFKVI